MSVDTTLIGETAAALMDMLPDETEGEIVAVGIVVVTDESDETYTRIKCSSERHYEQLGIFHAALSVVTSGDRWNDTDGDDDA
jgi:hypothetical protein